MGNEYSEENVLKEIEPIDYSDEYIKYGIVSKKGEEKSLDDCFLTLPDLSSSKEAKNPINFSLFGIFDGHNNNYVAKYLTNSFEEFFVKEAGNILENNCEKQFGDIFKAVDKKLKEEKNNNIENKEYINDDVNDNEIKYYKDLIEKTEKIPEDLKKVDDSQIKNLLLFRNLFKYNNNYLYNNNNPDYIGSSASLVMINNERIYVADLGITKCILFNSEGKILNDDKNTENKNENDYLSFDHIFSNKSEKKRIKKFNENIDYEKLKMNIYLPASRCFGLFKYKADEILKEENQIISCVPKVISKEKDSVDFILLMTKGMVNLLKDNLNEFIKKIVDIFRTQKEADIKITDLLNKYIEDKIKERDEKEKNNDKKEENKPKESIKNNLIYVGKEDFGEENEIINELKKNYYKDIMEMNKNSCYSCHEKYNITCMLLKVSKNKKPIIEVKKEKKVEEKKEEKKVEKKEEKEEEKKEKEEEKKEEKKEEEKKEEKKEDDNKIIEENKEKEKETEAQENKEENKEQPKEDKEKEKEAQENKEQPKEDKEKLEENKQENNNENKNDINNDANIEKKEEEKNNEEKKEDEMKDKNEEKKEAENNEEIK